MAQTKTLPSIPAIVTLSASTPKPLTRSTLRSGTFLARVGSYQVSSLRQVLKPELIKGPPSSSKSWLLLLRHGLNTAPRFPLALNDSPSCLKPPVASTCSTGAGYVGGCRVSWIIKNPIGALACGSASTLRSRRLFSMFYSPSDQSFSL